MDFKVLKIKKSIKTKFLFPPWLNSNHSKFHGSPTGIPIIKDSGEKKCKSVLADKIFPKEWGVWGCEHSTRS